MTPMNAKVCYLIGNTFIDIPNVRDDNNMLNESYIIAIQQAKIYELNSNFHTSSPELQDEGIYNYRSSKSKGGKEKRNETGKQENQ